MTHLKKLFYNFMTHPTINQAIKTSLKPIANYIPKHFLERIPIVGQVNVDFGNGKTLHMATDGGDAIAGMVFWLGLTGFERTTITLFRDLLKRSKVVFDIGANTGLFGLIAAVDDPLRQVFAFEPMPNVFKALLANVDLNNLKNLTCMQSAVTNFDGFTKFFTYPSLRIPYISSTLNLHANAVQITVPAITVDSFVSDSQIPPVDLMKVDTESTEPMVLGGATHTLQDHAPIIICEVLSGRQTEDGLHAILDKLDYDYFLIAQDSLIKRDRIVGDQLNDNFNYLFVPRRKSSWLESLSMPVKY